MKKRLMWIGRVLILFLVACAALAVIATPGSAQTVPNWWLGPDSEYIDLVNKAKAEGTVVWRSAPDPTKEMDSIFEREYGIKVDHVEIHSSEMLAQVMQEAAAGRKAADVVAFSLHHIPLLLKRDLIQRIDWSRAQAVRDSPAPDKLVISDGIAISSITWFRELAYNKDLVAEKDVPDSYEDLLDPKWAGGKIGIDTDLTNFLIIAQPHIWGVEKTVDYMRKLRKQKPKLHPNAGLITEWTASGEVLLGLNVHLNLTLKYPNLGWKALKPAVPVVTTPWLLLKSAAHPNAGKLFLYWLFHSREMWEAFNSEIPRVNAWVPVDRDLYEKFLPKTDLPLETMSYEWGVELAEKGVSKRLQKALGAK